MPLWETKVNSGEHIRTETDSQERKLWCREREVAFSPRGADLLQVFTKTSINHCPEMCSLCCCTSAHFSVCRCRTYDKIGLQPSAPNVRRLCTYRPPPSRTMTQLCVGWFSFRCHVTYRKLREQVRGDITADCMSIFLKVVQLQMEHDCVYFMDCFRNKASWRVS